MATNNSNPLPSTWRYDFSDFTSLGSTFQKFLTQANIFQLAVYNLLNAGIGYSNLQQSVYSVTVTAGSTTPISFVNPLPIVPSAVVLGQVLQVGNTVATLSNALSAANWFYDGRNINILNVAGLTSGKTYQISVVVS